MNSVAISTNCFHCGADCNDHLVRVDEKAFCCDGCVQVYQILHTNAMDQYYCLNERPGLKIAQSSTRYFPILDLGIEAAKFITFQDEHLVKASFFLPEIHCSSCIWLLEHLNKLNAGILHSAVNFTEKRIYLSFDPNKLSLRQAAELLSSLGYMPQLNLETSFRSQDQNKMFFIYTGIAGFAFANIMMMSFPEYLGLQVGDVDHLTYYFRYINLSLSIPVLYIAFKVFFLNAYRSLVNGYVNIDAPVSLAILITFIRSVFDILGGVGGGFLDSMSGIVFFMLIGRYLQQRTFSSLQFNRQLKSFFPITVEVIQPNGTTIPTYIQEVSVGQILMIRRGEIIPIDSEVYDGNSHVDYSYITGESRPIALNPGKALFAGGRVLSDAIRIKVLKSFSASDFTQLWNNEAFQKKDNKSIRWADRVGAYFTMAVFVIACTAFFYWLPEHPAKAWNALTSVLIIACPCALLLSSSYTLGFMAQLFAKKGLFVKNSGIIDTLTNLNHLVFDKTGTLTSSSQALVMPILKSWTIEERDGVLSLMIQSHHPLSQAITKYEEGFNTIPVSSWKEVKGQGLEGWVNDHHIKIGQADFVGYPELKSDKTEVLVSIDGAFKAQFMINSLFKPGVLSMLERLKSYKLTLLSGDSSGLYTEVSRCLPTNMACLLEQVPQSKLEHIKNLQAQGDFVMMMGDGLNDAGALKQSNLGVAVVEHYHSFAPACDIIMDYQQVPYLDQYLKAAKSAKNLIKGAFIYALIYNFIGLYFGVTAVLKPVLAAILMPISSIGVILIAYVGSRVICNHINISSSIQFNK